MSLATAGSRGHVDRARRYQLQLGLEYRADTPEPRYGHTHDVSVSGVLFEIESEELGALRVNASIEMRMMLPADRDGNVVSRVVCAGRIVRIVPGESGRGAHVAATIERHHLERVEPGPSNP